MSDGEKVYVAWPAKMYRLDGPEREVAACRDRSPLVGLVIIGTLVLLAVFLLGIAVGVGLR